VAEDITTLGWLELVVAILSPSVAVLSPGTLRPPRRLRLVPQETGEPWGPFVPKCAKAANEARPSLRPWRLSVKRSGLKPVARTFLDRFVFRLIGRAMFSVTTNRSPRVFEERNLIGSQFCG
jgi:hypothetical protein